MTLFIRATYGVLLTGFVVGPSYGQQRFADLVGTVAVGPVKPTDPLKVPYIT